MKIKPKKNPSVGFSGFLTILFIGLKLTGHINWSWWWVLSPMPIQFAAGVVLIATGVILQRVWK
jgi:predicted tellurium resistance membrane protein TerC